MPKGINIRLKRLFFFFLSPSFHKFDVCMYALQRSKANLCKSSHFTGNGTDKIDTELLFSSVLSWNGEGQTDAD